MRKIIIFITTILISGSSLSALSIDELKSKAPEGYSKLPSGITVEGVIVSDFQSLNMGENPQLEWNKVDTRVSYCTAYLQTEDGLSGIRIIFNDIYDNRIPKFSKVSIKLDGCTIYHQTQPQAVTVSGVLGSSVEVIEKNIKVQKNKKISELTDADLFTFVTLENLEFMSKEGSYTNVNEYFVQPSELNAYKKPANQDCIDVAGVYVRDNIGEAIFLPVNTSCYWRRRGERLPQGIGSISGILVPADYPRYGNVGKYALRIANPTDVNIPMEEASNYKVITEWNWDRNYKQALKFEDKGEKLWVVGKKLPAGKIVSDVGQGLLSTTVGAQMDLTHEFNTRNVHDGGRPGMGYRKAAALRLYSATENWFNSNAAILIEASTKDVVGEALSLDFTWCAGNGSVEESYGFPAYWRVAYSIDGRNFMPVDKIFTLRPQAYEKSPLAYQAAPGYVENTILLPGFLLDKDKIYIRILPAKEVLVERHSNPADNINSGAYSPGFSSQFVLCIGKISLKALK